MNFKNEEDSLGQVNNDNQQISLTSSTFNRLQQRNDHYKKTDTDATVENFVNSLNLPNTRERAVIQLNQAKEKYQNSKAILTLLEQALDIVKKSIEDSEDRQVLLNELAFNIHRHKFLVKKDETRMLIRQKDLEDITN
ncbi:hypothetical protein BY996DRAFT_7395616 [Phakopsora pachyrhizi]|uniref:Expressed protein n=1 Tax=Phakopsora pachyrhizi TaxID=170000 RepID=A0AAV0ANU0_PHAPC|nr:hypothetical protein BY996DRAFT_8293609 [Phakopsora pachyrhizi]KAI8450271.1 hypothetical protein BY996DRAFT_7395616 [Phakopsora pachyrhizi]CAH7668925.1 expressed protein [Phakopsora pachyrhizi]